MADEIYPTVSASLEPGLVKPRSKVNLRKVALALWVITNAMLVMGLLSGDWRIPQGLETYIGLWILISGLCLIFTFNFSFSGVLGHRLDLLEVPIYLSFTGLVLISLMGAAPYLDDLYLLPNVELLKDVPSGLILTGVGFLCMWGGYALSVGILKGRAIYKMNRPLTSTPSFDTPFFYRSLALYAVLVILRIVLYRNPSLYSSIPGVLQQPVTYLMELPWLFIALFYVQTASGRWPKWISVAVTILEVILIVLSGFSSSLIKLLFVLIASFNYVGKSLPYKFLLLLGLAGFLLTPLTRAMRDVNLSSVDSITNALSAEAETNWGGSSVGLEFNQNLFITRQSGTAQLPGLILKLTPSSIPYRTFSELISIPFSFIPRSLWPDKFSSGKAGSDFSVQYLGLNGASAAATTMAGSAYMYGGWLVMVFMMITVGIVFALTYYFLMIPALKTRQVGLFAMYAGLILANFHIGEGDISGLWQGLIQRGLIFFCCLVVLCYRQE